MFSLFLFIYIIQECKKCFKDILKLDKKVFNNVLKQSFNSAILWMQIKQVSERG